MLNGVLWVLRTGSPWHDLPDRYPPYHTCHRRFQSCVRSGALRRVLHTLAEDLRLRGGIDASEAFLDGTFSGAKKGGSASARPSAARGRRSWQLQTALAFCRLATDFVGGCRQRRTHHRGTRQARPATSSTSQAQDRVELPPAVPRAHAVRGIHRPRAAGRLGGGGGCVQEPGIAATQAQRDAVGPRGCASAPHFGRGTRANASTRHGRWSRRPTASGWRCCRTCTPCRLRQEGSQDVERQDERASSGDTPSRGARRIRRLRERATRFLSPRAPPREPRIRRRPGLLFRPARAPCSETRA